MTAVPPASLAQRIAIVLGSLILIVASLYWAKPVIVPIVLAVLLTFVLMPAVQALQRRGLGRVPATLAVVALLAAVLAGIGWIFVAQLQEFVEELPQHRHTIMEKVSAFQPHDGPLTNITKLIEDISKEMQGTAELIGPPAPNQPVPVVVRESAPRLNLDWLPAVLGTLAETAITIGLVLVLVVFMLIQRESLRNRVLRILSRGRYTATTRAIDDATQRISGFLINQTLINVGFGIALALGLMVVGMPYAVLWGALAGILRFIPYLGTWAIAGVLALFSIAIFPGWTQPLTVFGIFLALELIVFYAVEPLVLGHGTGVSPIALLLSAAFWAWLWGPIGLILATPMTVCLMVLGKHVPQLEFLGILLGDEPSLAPWESYYQRLLARDEEEAADLVEDYLRTNPPETLGDAVLVPALVQAERDVQRGDLDLQVRNDLFRVTREVLEDVALSVPAVPPNAEIVPVTVIACPAADEADELALRMFAQLLDPTRVRLLVLSQTPLAGEVVSLIAQEQATIALVAGVPPRCLARARYLCKRLRSAYPNLKIIAGYWGGKERAEAVVKRLTDAGASEVGLTLLESRDKLLPYIPLAAGVKERAGRERALAGAPA